MDRGYFIIVRIYYDSVDIFIRVWFVIISKISFIGIRVRVLSILIIGIDVINFNWIMVFIDI